MFHFMSFFVKIRKGTWTFNPKLAVSNLATKTCLREALRQAGTKALRLFFWLAARNKKQEF